LWFKRLYRLVAEFNGSAGALVDQILKPTGQVRNSLLIKVSA
jgi:hypothetical protein